MPDTSSLLASCIAAALWMTGSVLPAQNVFKVQVTPTVVGRSGNVISMRYTVQVMPGSTDSLSLFVIDAPGARLHVVEPTPSTAWATRASFSGRPVAAWMLLEQLTTAGNTTPPLEVSGPGVLGVVSYWAKPDAPWGEGEDDRPTVPAAKAASADPVGVPGKTIGIVVPPDQSPEALASRLGVVIGQACALDWVDNAGVCNSLQVKSKPDRNSLHALQNELDAQRGKHVSEAGYIVLTDNVAYLLSKL
jgi:hypothetical protein